MPNVPNPFNPSTTLTFTLPTTGVVTLMIYDLHDQVVCSLVKGYRAAGQHKVVWDGKDEGGHAVASGVYLTRLQMGGLTQTRKMLLMK